MCLLALGGEHIELVFNLLIHAGTGDGVTHASHPRTLLLPGRVLFSLTDIQQ